MRLSAPPLAAILAAIALIVTPALAGDRVRITLKDGTVLEYDESKIIVEDKMKPVIDGDRATYTFADDAPVAHATMVLVRIRGVWYIQ